MPSAVKAIPDGCHSLTPYLIVKGGARAIEFVSTHVEDVPPDELERRARSARRPQS